MSHIQYDTAPPAAVAPLLPSQDKKVFIAPPGPSEFRFVEALHKAASVGVGIGFTKHHNIVASHQNRLLGPFANPVTQWEVFPPMLLEGADDPSQFVYIVRFGHENADIRTLIDALASQADDAPAPDAWEVYPGHKKAVTETYPGLRALVILPVSMATLTQQEAEGSKGNG